jgi:hypothetical protein
VKSWHAQIGDPTLADSILDPLDSGPHLFSHFSTIDLTRAYGSIGPEEEREAIEDLFFPHNINLPQLIATNAVRRALADAAAIMVATFPRLRIGTWPCGSCPGHRWTPLKRSHVPTSK